MKQQPNGKVPGAQTQTSALAAALPAALPAAASAPRQQAQNRKKKKGDMVVAGEGLTEWRWVADLFLFFSYLLFLKEYESRLALGSTLVPARSSSRRAREGRPLGFGLRIAARDLKTSCGIMHACRFY